MNEDCKTPPSQIVKREAFFPPEPPRKPKKAVALDSDNRRQLDFDDSPVTRYELPSFPELS